MNWDHSMNRLKSICWKKYLNSIWGRKLLKHTREQLPAVALNDIILISKLIESTFEAKFVESYCNLRSGLGILWAGGGA